MVGLVHERQPELREVDDVDVEGAVGLGARGDPRADR
jgi:hypothetical protein